MHSGRFPDAELGSPFSSLIKGTLCLWVFHNLGKTQFLRQPLYASNTSCGHVLAAIFITSAEILSGAGAFLFFIEFDATLSFISFSDIFSVSPSGRLSCSGNRVFIISSIISASRRPWLTKPPSLRTTIFYSMTHGSISISAQSFFQWKTLLRLIFFLDVSSFP